MQNDYAFYLKKADGEMFQLIELVLLVFASFAIAVACADHIVDLLISFGLE